MEHLLFGLLGLAVGLSQQTLGVGGGFLLVPALPFLLGQSTENGQLAVVASSLLLSLSVALLNLYKSRSDFSHESLGLGLRLGVFSGAASYWTADHADVLSDQLLSGLFISVVGGLGLISVWPNRSPTNSGHKSESDRRPFNARMSVFTALRDALFSVVSGALSALSGISGGIFFTPYVSRFSRLKDTQVIPVSILALTLTLLGSVLRYSSSELSLPYADLPVFFLGAITGAELGKRFSKVVPRDLRTRALGVILILISSYTAWREFGSKLN